MSFFTALSKIVATMRRYVKGFVTHSLDISAMIYRKIPLFCTALYLNVINSVYIWISIYIFLSMSEHIFPLLFHCFPSLITISLLLAPSSVSKATPYLSLPHPWSKCSLSNVIRRLYTGDENECEKFMSVLKSTLRKEIAYCNGAGSGKGFEASMSLHLEEAHINRGSENSREKGGCQGWIISGKIDERVQSSRGCHVWIGEDDKRA